MEQVKKTGRCVVAMVAHPKGKWKQGDEFRVIRRYAKGGCKCGYALIEIGFRKTTAEGWQRCPHCKQSFRTNTSFYAYPECNFIPVEEVEAFVDEIIRQANEKRNC